jgi:hypothetical protein
MKRRKSKKNLGKNKDKNKLCLFDCWIHQLAVTYVYIGAGHGSLTRTRANLS